MYGFTPHPQPCPCWSPLFIHGSNKCVLLQGAVQPLVQFLFLFCGQERCLAAVPTPLHHSIRPPSVLHCGIPGEGPCTNPLHSFCVYQTPSGSQRRLECFAQTNGCLQSLQQSDRVLYAFLLCCLEVLACMQNNKSFAALQ